VTNEQDQQPIPTDLADHWFWYRGALAHDDGLIMIAFPPPRCFEIARYLDAKQAERDARPAQRKMQL
jgi:hypothetical protein